MIKRLNLLQIGHSILINSVVKVRDEDRFTMRAGMREATEKNIHNEAEEIQGRCAYILLCVPRHHLCSHGSIEKQALKMHLVSTSMTWKAE